MAKFTPNTFSSLTANETSTIASLNENFEEIADALEVTLSRDGTSPNEMNDLLDMNGNRVVHLPKPVYMTEPLRLQDLNDFLAGDFAGGATEVNASVYYTIAELRLKDNTASAAVVCEVLSWHAPSVYVDNTAHGGGTFRLDPDDTTTADDSFACIVDASGKRWKRDIGLEQDIAAWGIIGDGSVETTAVALMISHINNTDKTKPYYIDRPNIVLPGGFEVGFYGKQVLTRGFVNFTCSTRIVGGGAGFIIPKSSSHVLGGMFVIGRKTAAAGRVTFEDIYLQNKSWLYDNGTEQALHTVRGNINFLKNCWLIDCAGIKHGQGANKPGGIVMEDVRIISNSALAAPGFNLVAGAGIVARNVFITDRRFNIFSSADASLETDDGWTLGGSWIHTPSRFRMECDQASGTSILSAEIAPDTDLVNGQTYNFEYSLAILRDGGGSITPRLSNGAGSYVTGATVTGAVTGIYDDSLVYATGHNIIEFVLTGDYSVRLRGSADRDTLVFERPASAAYRSWKMGCESYGANIDSVRLNNFICNPRVPENVWEWDLSYEDCGNIRISDSFAETCTDASLLVHSDNRWSFPITAVTKISSTVLQIVLDPAIVEDAVNGIVDYEDAIDEFFVGDTIGLAGLGGMVEANGSDYVITAVNTTGNYIRVTTPDNTTWGAYTSGGGVLKAVGFLNDCIVQGCRFTPRSTEECSAIKIRNTYSVPIMLTISKTQLAGARSDIVDITAGDIDYSRHGIVFDGCPVVDRSGSVGANHDVFAIGVNGVSISDCKVWAPSSRPGDALASSTLQKFVRATANIDDLTVTGNDMRGCNATEVIDIAAITSIDYGGNYMIDNNVGNTYVNVMPKKKAKSLGTISSGTLTPDPLNGELQYYTNDGAHTLAVPTMAGDYQIRIMMTMGASAGAVTISGAVYQGNTLTTTAGFVYLIAMTKINGVVQVVGSKYQ